MEWINGYWTAIQHISILNSKETEKLVIYSIQSISALATLFAAVFAAISAKSSKEISRQTKDDFENRRKDNISAQIEEILRFKSEIVGIYNKLIYLFAAKSLEISMYVHDTSVNDAIKYDGYGNFTEKRKNALDVLRKSSKEYENLAQEANIGDELKNSWSMADIHSLRIKIHTIELRGFKIENEITVAKYTIEKTSGYGISNKEQH